MERTWRFCTINCQQFIDSCFNIRFDLGKILMLRGHLASGSNTLLYATVAGLALITVAIGVAAQPVLVLAMATAEQLLDPTRYITAVLGGAP